MPSTNPPARLIVTPRYAEAISHAHEAGYLAYFSETYGSGRLRTIWESECTALNKPCVTVADLGTASRPLIYINVSLRHLVSPRATFVPAPAFSEDAQRAIFALLTETCDWVRWHWPAQSCTGRGITHELAAFVAQRLVVVGVQA
jgi:hypothetical protein